MFLHFPLYNFLCKPIPLNLKTGLQSLVKDVNMRVFLENQICLESAEKLIKDLEKYM